MKTWEELCLQHEDVRKSPKTWTGELRKRLISLADAGYCDRSIRSRFTNSKNNNVEKWSIRPAGGSEPEIGEPLHKIQGMHAAWLSVYAMVDRDDSIQQLDVRATGKRKDGTQWVIAVHLSDAQMNEGRHGLGACGHAVLHCHVGPDLDALPEIRVPLPALGPVQVLEWVLSQLIPTEDFEPAPWSSVKAAPI